MAIGYLISPTLQTNFDHTNTKHFFYGPANTWWCAAQDDTASDWALWKWDGGFPASEGSAGNWAIADVVTTKANVYLDTRGSSQVMLRYEAGAGVNSQGRLHVFAAHGTELYSTWDYATSTDDWVNTDSGADTGIVNAEEAGFVVDSNGIPWLVYYDATNGDVEVRYRSGGTWSNDTQVRASVTATPGSDGMIDAVQWIDDDGDEAICTVYGDGDVYYFTSKKDSDTLGSGSWLTRETVYNPTNMDSHVNLCAAKFTGDTTSTVICTLKDGDGNVARCFRRTPAGSWQSSVTAFSVSTRPKGFIDTTNEELYVLAPDNSASPTSVDYVKCDATTTLSFGSATEILEHDGTTVMLTDVAIPCHNVDSTMNAMVGGESSSGTDRVWWNRISIAAPPAGGGGLSLLGVGT